MALIEKITAIADAIRKKTGSSGLMNLDEMAETISAMDTGSGEVTTLDNTYILVDENGYEIPAVLTEEEIKLTATTNDIRIGTTAVTDEGVVTGEKEIPAYTTVQGVRTIKPGESLDILMYSDECQYTKLQVIICAYNTSYDDSVSAEMVVINDKLYAVGSTVVLSAVGVDVEAQSIKLGIINEGENSLLIRYVTIKEE